jgi:hypothetical protein
VFDDRCNLPACHGGGTVQASLNLEAANSAGIIGRPATQNPSLPLVEIGNVPGSYLAIKILPDAELMDLGLMRLGLAMPNGAVIDAATQQDLALVLGWIAGADLPGGGTGGTSMGTDGGTSSAGTGTASASTGTGDSTTGEPIQYCGLQDLKPGAPNPIDEGDVANKIPTEIGTLLRHNCGCHLADDLAVTVPDFPASGLFQMTTLAQWQGTYGPNMTVTKDKVRSQLDTEVMPNTVCNVGGGEHMDPADRARLIEWIDADVPDGANWPP